MASEFKSLLKSTSMLAGTRFAQFFASLARVKISALILGTTGVGIVDQITFLTNKVSQFTTIGTAEAFVKQLAESKSKDDAKSLIYSAFKSYALVIFGFVVLSVGLMLGFKEEVTNYLFGEDEYIVYFFVALLTFPILVIHSFPFSILKAFKNVRAISRARIITSAIQFVISIPLILIWELEGAVAYVPLAIAIDVAVLMWLANKKCFQEYEISFARIIKAPLRRDFLKELFLFSAFGLTVGVFLIIVELVTRSIVLDHLGVDAIGLYSPILLFASIFTGFILPALSTYLYPRFSEMKGHKEVSGLINDALRIGSFGLIPLLFIGIPYHKLIIVTFYSTEFLDASNYLPYHLMGTSFFVWWYVFSQSLTPMGKIKVHGVFRLFYGSIDLLVTYWAVNRYGLIGWTLKFIVSPFVFFWVYMIYTRITFDFSYRLSTLKLMAYVFIGGVSLTVLSQMNDLTRNLNFVIGPLLLLGTWYIASKEERNALLSKLRRK
ncbi:oligosaccharide flippase family protein [Phaeocystidibacter marisrubri]|uniref:oligosaccharide flippase family protein n=1 Tax=Phaeocystidibacter marisrubri TaxID=1577780 RepID=UPI0021D31423|nr:oligosaccharide flippase family protein [Phaeocystidibacter marisrubri]